LHPPWDVPLVVVANATLTCIGWFLLPPAARDWLFKLHGPLAFPVVLESWMLADVPATNVLGEDASGAVSVLLDRKALLDFLDAKRVALWAFVAPICALLALVIGFNHAEQGADPEHAKGHEQQQCGGRERGDVGMPRRAAALTTFLTDPDQG
jgi:hypothetical protein